MAFTHTVGMSYKTPSGTISSVLQSYTSDSVIEAECTVAGSTTNYELDVAFGYANIKSCLLSSTGAVTVKTNNSGSPVDTITLTSSILAKVYTNDGAAGNLASNPFTANVTKLYITNAGADAVTFKLRVLYDGTPA